MVQHILVPLDGSRLAEAALPVAMGLAAQLRARVTLLHVIEQNAPASVHGEPHLTTEAAARTYLAEAVDRVAITPIIIQIHVHNDPTSNVVQSIVVHAQELASDLIVICSHGGNSVQKRLFGSIAQAVVAQGGTPVLLVNPETAPTTFHCTRLLVALDGNREHEAGLRLAAETAQACHAQLDLVLVIPTRATLSPTQAATGRLLPQATAAFLDSLAESGLTYLEDKQRALAPFGLEIACAVQRGDPAEAIAATAAANNADLIVLATHGKGNLDAFWSGSVTPRLVVGAQWPLLLVPVEDGRA